MNEVMLLHQAPSDTFGKQLCISERMPLEHRYKLLAM